MVQTDALFLTFFVKAESYGTAFVVTTMDDDQYLVTARHLFKQGCDEWRLSVSKDKKWLELELDLVGVGRGDVDIIVFKCPTALRSSEFKLELGVGGYSLGQDMFFLGFPYKLAGDVGDFLDGLPCAYVKRGVFSMFDASGGHVLYLDAMNNEGFSGGPLLFAPSPLASVQAPLTPGQAPQLRVAGVVSRFRVEHEIVYDRDGNDTGMTVQYNTGIMAAYGMKHVIDIVQQYRPAR